MRFQPISVMLFIYTSYDGWWENSLGLFLYVVLFVAYVMVVYVGESPYSFKYVSFIFLFAKLKVD